MNGKTRDIGLKSTGPGKGDAPRNTGPKFYENFDEIQFRTPARENEWLFGFRRKGNRVRKVYR